MRKKKPSRSERALARDRWKRSRARQKMKRRERNERSAKLRKEYGNDYRAYNACGRKIRYDTKEEAETYAIKSEIYSGEKKYRVYRCQYCGGWHLTTHVH